MLVSRFPFPLEKGDKLRTYYQLKSLSEDFSITLIALTDQKITSEQLSHIQPYCDQIEVVKRTKLNILFNVFLTFFSNKPFQIGFFYSFLGQLKVNRILKEVEPAYIYCQLIRAAEYVKNYHACPKTLDYMDALSMGIERRIKKTPWIYRIVFKIEAKRLKLYERSVFDYFEVKTIISEQDKQLILHPEKQQIHVIPNGIDPHFFEPLTIEATNELVFVGNLNYPPNIEAIDFIITELLPKNTSYKYLISGANPSVSLIKRSSKLPQITLNGWVDDIRTAYLSGKIFIAPMKIGTGMQNKLLEAMAVGLPCITTTLANNAIHAVHNESILVADTPEEFISCIDQLLTDPSLYKKIAENGRKLVQEKYSWKKTTLILTDLIQNECMNK